MDVLAFDKMGKLYEEESRIIHSTGILQRLQGLSEILQQKRLMDLFPSFECYLQKKTLKKTTFMRSEL